ncbi:right-handed parallel beta-helix repeat-containing protein [Sphingomonas sp.]|uniref:right-handed parallel beta-helix repeat-containing protein n=1 Tax=Sphingomonas sp. TaxID=28214 RepID=UPI001DFE5290|nr:right-handed parallel beta-helix repeat-containing protein [Sphingomonas sp.]MBX9795962.1 right-handed parallel beta-helix repeat-containing protein [Sphingomonas sp.]
MRRILPFLAIALTAPAAAQGGPGAFTIAETGESFATLDQALVAAKPRGEFTWSTILIAPGVYRQCAVQEWGKTIFRARQPGTVVFDGTACEGKAVLVLRGRGAEVDGIVFRNIRVPDGNGAGIRSEIGDLTVKNAMFLDSQEGILGGVGGNQRIIIEYSTFAGLGQCDETPDCAHSIYLANKGQITVRNNRFERGRGGHYVKLRTPRVDITDNSFDDTRGRKTNYMIDLSEGGTGVISGNNFVQGRDKENHSALISVAPEARTYSSAGLRIVNNSASLSPGDTRNPAFVADASRERLAIGANRLGPGIRPFEQR